MKKSHRKNRVQPDKNLNTNKSGSTSIAKQEGKPGFNDLLLLYCTVTITGAAVMMIELLGTRIIGPFYGVSLIVWSSLISVTLMALAIGYFIGGKLADKAGPIRLSQIIWLAAVFTGIIPLVSEPVQSATDFMGLRAGAFFSALTLFTIPLALLGMVGPFVIKMAAHKLDSVGSISGSVYAVSTVGSVLGTLFLGFYLLPVAGTRTVIMAVSLALLILAMGLFFYENKRLQVLISPSIWSLLCFFAALVIFASSQISQGKQYKSYKVLSDAESHYGWVRVVDRPDDGIRLLMSGSSVIGAGSVDGGQSLLGYQQIVKQVSWLNPQGKDALLIGLGGGYLVQELEKQGIKTDSIEIDEAVAEAAKEFFDFESEGELVVGDARYQVRQLKGKYDFIIHDCFTGGSEPSHLLSLEMLGHLKAMLNPGGILALNFVGFAQGDEGRAVETVARTLEEVFEYKRTFVSTPGENFNDFIFFASDRPLRFGSSSQEKKIATLLEKHELSISGKNAFVITDDFNPLESLQVSKAEKYRELMINRLGKEILLW